MKWSWKIAEVAGIGIYLHGTLLLLLIWIGLFHYLHGNDLIDALHGVLFVVLLFTIIVLHELGHALAARRYGIPTKDITLLPIGGVARLERMPENPRHEFVVALAGPAVNIVLAALLFFAVQLLAGPTDPVETLRTGAAELGLVLRADSDLSNLSDSSIFGVRFLAKFAVVNLMLAVFNLLPAFPMDGGRVLRALLAMRLEYVRATHIAAVVGQLMAFAFGLLGLLGNPFLLFIALFVWMGASSEASMVQMRSALEGIPVSRAMVTDLRTISPDDRLDDVAAHVISGFQQDFPVMQGGQLVGMLTKADLLRALAEQGRSESVESVMRRDFEKAEPSEMLESVFTRLRGCDCHSLPVVSGGELAGLVTMENVGEFMMIQSALRRESPARRFWRRGR